MKKGCFNCKFYQPSDSIPCGLRDGYLHNWRKAGECPDWEYYKIKEKEAREK